MARVVYRKTETLFPRLDKNHFQVAKDEVNKLLEENPDFSKPHTSMEITVFDSGNAYLTITVTDKSKIDWSKYAWVGVCIGLLILLYRVG